MTNMEKNEPDGLHRNRLAPVTLHTTQIHHVSKPLQDCDYS